MGKTKEARSLVDYVKDKKRADCPVCQLSQDVRDQLSAAKTRKIPRRDQLEWLNAEVGVDITGGDLDAHYSGRHSES